MPALPRGHGVFINLYICLTAACAMRTLWAQIPGSVLEFPCKHRVGGADQLVGLGYAYLGHV